MVDRTDNTTFDPQTEPGIISGRTSASDGDTFKLPDGNRPLACHAESALNTDDVIVGVSGVSTETITLSCIEDGGTAVTADFNIDFIAIVDPQT